MLALPASAGAFPRPLPSASAIFSHSDALDLLYLGKDRPIWIRMHLRIGDKPFGRLWEEYVDAQFKFLDRNNDGRLDETECDRVMNALTMRQIILTGYPNVTGANPAALRLLDTDLSGSVSRAELANYFQTRGMLRLLVQGLYDPDPYAQVVSKIIFTLLDKDADGKLTKAEADAAERWLDALDYDQDEYITTAEVAPGIFNGGIAARNTRSTIEVWLYQLGCAQEPIKQQAQKLLDRYDKDKDYHLTKAEIGVDSELFRSLDRDGTGKLDVPELADWFSHAQPDARLKMTVPPQGQAATAQLLSHRQAAVSAREAGAGHVVIQVGRQSFEFGVRYVSGVASTATQRDLFRRNLLQSFDQARAGMDYVDGKSTSLMQNAFMKSLLFYADRNRDNQLTRKEFDEYLDLTQMLAGTGIGLSLYPQSLNWFGILDENGDGRLSRTELRHAWSSLTTRLDITGTEIQNPESPGGLQLVLHQGQRMYANYTGRNYLSPPPVGPPEKGPVWFRKMDRNGDGSISRREFLGNKADFDQIDSDHDGLISVEEAEKAALSPSR